MYHPASETEYRILTTRCNQVQLEFSKTARLENSPRKYTQTCGMLMTGPQSVGWRTDWNNKDILGCGWAISQREDSRAQQGWNLTGGNLILKYG